MANVIRGGKGPDTKQQNQQQVDIESAGFGAKAAIAAFQETKTEKTAPGAASEKTIVAKQGATTESKQSRQGRKGGTSQAHHATHDVVADREKASLKLIGVTGTTTGVQAKSNRQLTQVKPGGGPATSVVDAWEDPNEVSSRDDPETALQKRFARALEEESRIESQIDAETPLADLTEANGLNDVTQPMRDYGNYGALNKSPDLIILMNGISESFDALLERNGITMPDTADLNGAQLQEIFTKLNLKKKKSLSEEEKEAELILAGAVAILAIPQIQEKLENLGMGGKEAESLRGLLTKLIEEVKQDDHPYHHLYSLIKEETEYSIVPEEPDSASS